MLPSKSLPSALQRLQASLKYDQLNPNNIQLNIRFKPGSAATWPLQLTWILLKKWIKMGPAKISQLGICFVFSFLWSATFILGPEVQVGPIEWKMKDFANFIHISGPPLRPAGCACPFRCTLSFAFFKCAWAATLAEAWPHAQSAQTETVSPSSCTAVHSVPELLSELFSSKLVWTPG